MEPRTAGPGPPAATAQVTGASGGQGPRDGQGPHGGHGPRDGQAPGTETASGAGGQRSARPCPDNGRAGRSPGGPARSLPRPAGSRGSARGPLRACNGAQRSAGREALPAEPLHGDVSGARVLVRRSRERGGPRSALRSGRAAAMDSPYANGAYSPPYPHYASLPQARGFYCSGPPRSPYPPEPPGLYRPPSPAPAWSYVPPECPPEGSALRRQQVPGYSPPQTPGMPMPQYPYGDSSAGVTGQGPVPQPRALEDTWGPHSGFGVQPRYAWPASGHGSLYVSDSHPPWTGSGAPSHPPSWESQGQDSIYDRPEQSPGQHGYYSDGNQRHSGPVNEHRVAKPAPSQPRVQYSAQPQLYDLAPRKPVARSQELGFKPADQPATHPAALQPEIQRILHVMGEAEQLEEEVDEFVGKKTDKSYRLLEEMLTKLLLELDSIETGGQDSVRQARKESVHRIQAILEKLERKGL